MFHRHFWTFSFVLMSLAGFHTIYSRCKMVVVRLPLEAPPSMPVITRVPELSIVKLMFAPVSGGKGKIPAIVTFLWKITSILLKFQLHFPDTSSLKDSRSPFRQAINICIGERWFLFSIPGWYCNTVIWSSTFMKNLYILLLLNRLVWTFIYCACCIKGSILTTSVLKAWDCLKEPIIIVVD